MPGRRRALPPRQVPGLLSKTTSGVLSSSRRLLEDACLGFPIRYHLAIACLIFSCHPAGRESLLEPGADYPSVETRKVADSFHGIFLAIDDEARHAVLDHFRNGAGAVSDHRRPARHRLDHHQTERLGPVDRKQQCGGSGGGWLLLSGVDFAAQSYLFAIDIRLKLLL